MAEVLDKLSGEDMSDVETKGTEAPAKPDKEPVKVEKAEPEKTAAELDKTPEKKEAEPAKITETEKPEATESDVDALLKEVEKATAPGGVPAGVIHDLQEERRARQEAEQRSAAFERDLAELRASQTAATTKTCSLEEAIERGEIAPDDVVTASQQVQWNKNARERDATKRQRTEQESNRAVDVLKSVAKTQEEQVSATLSAGKVGAARSYSRVVAMGMPLITDKDAGEIAQLIQRGGNGAVELYKRCVASIVREYPQLKEVLTGKSKTGAPGIKTEIEKEKTGEITQETILETSDLQAAEDMFLK